mmetsp:Transcript_72681/g.210403  ORF Transcript_72681/g.210403 Transcript_72681/m.210403 type:complete len:709 (+) Transcript_72681:43-2169(+)
MPRRDESPPQLFPGDGERTSLARCCIRPRSASRRHQVEIDSVAYPMYVLPVPTLLSMDCLRPHQELLRESLVKEWMPEMEGRIIFVSHQWLGYANPDPNNEHLSALQTLLSRLMEGTAGHVESHWMQQVVMRQKVAIARKRWREAVPHMYTWIDYASIPQVGLASAMRLASETQSAEAQGGMHRLCAAVPHRDIALKASPCPVQNALGFLEAGVDPASPKVGCSSDRASASSARDASVVKASMMAINSIPQYVERSALLLVLAPMCLHKDTGEVCDYTTWRSRGWCRMELQAALLARTHVQVLVCAGPRATPHLLRPVDAIQLPAGEGEFSCCALGHTFQERHLKCDKAKVLRNVASMLDRRVEHLKQQRRFVDMRFFASARHLFLKGAKRRRHIAETGNVATAHFRDRLAWSEGDDRRAVDGWSLLHYAALADNLDVARHLLTPRVHGGFQLDPNVAVRCGDPQLTVFAGTTPLMLAMMYAQWEVVSALLDAKAEPHTVTGGFSAGLDAFMLGVNFGDVRNLQSWLERFPQWQLERADQIANQTPFQQAAIIRRSSAPQLQTLLAASANVGHIDDLGATPLHSLTSKDDADIAAAMVLVNDCNANVNAQQQPRSLKWRVLFGCARVLARSGSQRPFLKEMARWEGGTPLTNAAAHGNVRMIRFLLQARADISLTNAQGRTPLDVAHISFGGEVPSMLAEALSPGRHV